MAFQIIRNDIAKVQADAIVNTANPRPVVGSGTDSAIYAAAGEEALLAERRIIGDIPRGEVACTPAFALRAKYIIHTVGPRWVDGTQGEREVLRSCYEKSLALAAKLGCESIAFPLISSGVYGFPKDEALNIALLYWYHQPFRKSLDIFLSGLIMSAEREGFRLRMTRPAKERKCFHMEMTSAQANKLLRQLQGERELLLSQESQVQVYIAATTEKLEDARPAYDYNAVRDQIAELERNIRLLKHSISAFNLTHAVPGFDMTIDQLLVYLPQLDARKNRLERMARHAPKARLNTSTRSNIIEYEYANYDVEQIRSELKAVIQTIAQAQLALEQLNTTLTFDVEL